MQWARKEPSRINYVEQAYITISCNGQFARNSMLASIAIFREVRNNIFNGSNVELLTEFPK